MARVVFRDATNERAILELLVLLYLLLKKHIYGVFSAFYASALYSPLGVEPDDVDLDAYQHEWIEVELLPQAPQNEDSFGDMDVEPDLRKRTIQINWFSMQLAFLQPSDMAQNTEQMLIQDLEIILRN